HFEDPRLRLWNNDLADSLRISASLQADSSLLSAYFSGQRLFEGSKPVATAYAAHQFGHFVPQLGDGRAHLLGDTVDTCGQMREIQLKGSGTTPFSRRGDGRCALGPAVREYVMSEAMFALGVPTTRCLAVVTTGESVYRNQTSPGAVVTRVASSHIRVGTFQYFAARGDVESLQKLCDETIQRHYPELLELVAEKKDCEKPVLLLEKAMQQQIELIVEWMRVGFIHGVMNTDNTALSGETIDYGPCAMMGNYDPNTVFSSIDQTGRYAFAHQAKIALWNMSRLAESLLVLVDKDEDKAVDQLTPILETFSAKFNTAYMAMVSKKFGLISAHAEDEVLIQDILQQMRKKALDYTNTFDALTKSVVQAPLDMDLHADLGSCYEQWYQRVTHQARPVEQTYKLM
ncbi:MAG: YdiU family protein, partial [Ghiorsea sp.]